MTNCSTIILISTIAVIRIITNVVSQVFTCHTWCCMTPPFLLIYHFRAKQYFIGSHQKILRPPLTGLTKILRVSLKMISAKFYSEIN